MQQYKENSAAQRYMNFYPVEEWPHVAILDPRTGQRLVVWTTISDGTTFCDLATEFLTLHPPFDERKKKRPEGESSSASSSASASEEPRAKKPRTNEDRGDKKNNGVNYNKDVCFTYYWVPIKSFPLFCLCARVTNS